MDYISIWWQHCQGDRGFLKFFVVFGIKNLLFPYCKMNTILHECVWYCKNKNPLKYAQLSTCGLVTQLVVAPNNHLGGMGLNLTEAWILSRLQWPARIMALFDFNLQVIWDLFHYKSSLIITCFFVSVVVGLDKWKTPSWF